MSECDALLTVVSSAFYCHLAEKHEGKHSSRVYGATSHYPYGSDHQSRTRVIIEWSEPDE